MFHCTIHAKFLGCCASIARRIGEGTVIGGNLTVLPSPCQCGGVENRLGGSERADLAAGGLPGPASLIAGSLFFLRDHHRPFFEHGLTLLEAPARMMALSAESPCHLAGQASRPKGTMKRATFTIAWVGARILPRLNVERQVQVVLGFVNGKRSAISVRVNGLLCDPAAREEDGDRLRFDVPTEALADEAHVIEVYANLMGGKPFVLTWVEMSIGAAQGQK